MPRQGIILTPGQNSELTETTLRAGYSKTSLGRFKSGLFQKIGGWTKFSSNLVSGNPRATFGWQSLAGNKMLAVGSTSALTSFKDSTQQVITPQTFLSDVAPSFTTTIGSNIVTVADTNLSTVTSYDAVFFNTPVSVDGIILSGFYPIITTVSSTSYTIQAATAGVAGVSAGGAVPKFTTASGSYNVTVTLNAHGLSVGSDIVFPIATTVGGVTILGRYLVTSITDANKFVITAASAATGTAGPTGMNSSNAEFVYYIAIGPNAPGGAYGSGNYGAGAYGLGITLIGQTGTPITATDWTLVNWGEDLIACPQGGPIYYWGPNSGFSTAQPIGVGPALNSGAFVSTATQMVIAYGSTVPAVVGVYQDPLWVNWCDIQNFFSWVPSTTNQAGGFRLSSGSAIVAGAATPNCNLLWTDLDVWTMTYLGAPLVFGFLKTGSNCGLIAKHAFTQLAGNVYWCGKNNIFQMAGGTVSPMPCPVWDVIFQDLNPTYASLVFAGSNTLFSEVIIGYPSIADGQAYCTRYVKYNTVEGTWDTGSLQRNTWMDQSVLGSPIATTNTGLIYSHESGMDADLSPITSSFTTGYFYIDEAREYVFINQIVPDFKWGEYGGSQNATLQIYVNAVKNPGDTPTVYGPFTVTQSSPAITKRIRARQISLTVQSSDSGSFWRLGECRFRYSIDGTR